ncbi:MAG: hypothetical protein ABJC10_14060 [Acidobacteriota bacterium]
MFAAILIGMADESREVRAAAERALNRLSVERADAYVRVVSAAAIVSTSRFRWRTLRRRPTPASCHDE